VNWATVAATLEAGSAPAPDARNSRTTWLATVNEDGGAHVTAVGALWLDGAFWFQTGAGTRKGRNVTRDPRCSAGRPDSLPLLTLPIGGSPCCSVNRYPAFQTATRESHAVDGKTSGPLHEGQLLSGPSWFWKISS
jgi:hypothetical protein